MDKILIIEDDDGIGEFLCAELVHEGFLVEREKTGRAALSRALGEKFDLILLDVMIPEMNGLEVLRRLRASSNIPVILETARGETVDKINGLNLGADDYISKPFEIDELLARINAVLRRSKNQIKNEKSQLLCACGIELDSEKMSAKKDGESLSLSRTEFLLLRFFLLNAGKVLSRDAIIDAVWGKNHCIDMNSVDVYVGYLREKIGRSAIQTVRGSGFMLSLENR